MVLASYSHGFTKLFGWLYQALCMVLRSYLHGFTKLFAWFYQAVRGLYNAICTVLPRYLHGFILQRYLHCFSTLFV
jgi:hypothetical protein